jgi:uncharacterized membrane protein
MTDTPVRSLVKTLTWRIVGSSSTFAIAYLVTGSVGASSGIAIIQMCVNTVLYWLHEKTWNNVKWGKQ